MENGYVKDVFRSKFAKDVKHKLSMYISKTELVEQIQKKTNIVRPISQKDRKNITRWPGSSLRDVKQYMRLE